jgi:hypothetical protein
LVDALYLGTLLVTCARINVWTCPRCDVLMFLERIAPWLSADQRVSV